MMKIKKFIYFIFSLHVSVPSFAEPKEYSANDFTQIEKTVRNAFHAKVEDLRGSGPYKMQVLSQAIAQEPDPKKFPFIGYGKTPQEAQMRAALMCIKWQCEIQPQKMLEVVEEWKNLPAEKLMDYFNATGKLDEYPAELKADPEKFKDYILKNRMQSIPTCDAFNRFQLTLIYIQCTSTGVMDISNTN